MKYLQVAEDMVAILPQLAQNSILWLDTEVADYKTKKTRLSLIQILSLQQGIYIFDVLDQRNVIDAFIATIMENKAIEKVFHNANYDLRLLGKERVKNVTCTLEIARSIPYHKLPIVSKSLKSLVEYFDSNAEVDKSEQETDWGKRPLTVSQINYAGLDVVYLQKIHQELLNLLSQKPEDEDILALSTRYQQIEKQVKVLNAEFEDIRKRLILAMKQQDIWEINGVKLLESQRLTTRVNIQAILKYIQEESLVLDFPVTLTKEIQKQLGKGISHLPVEETVTTVSSLKVCEVEEEDLPF